MEILTLGGGWSLETQ